MSRYVVRVTIPGEGSKYRQRGRFVENIEHASRYPHPSAARHGAIQSLLKIAPRFKPQIEIVDTRDGTVVFNG